MQNNVRTTVRLPHALRQAMSQKIIKEGYGFRGKSKWVTEAIESLLKMNNYPDYVDIADEMSELTEIEVLQIPRLVKLQLDTALVNVRQKFPALEGVQSCIIRSSIIQRLIRT